MLKIPVSIRKGIIERLFTSKNVPNRVSQTGRALGLAGALGGAGIAIDLLRPDEAEAFPIGKFLSKSLVKKIPKVSSSAAKALKGFEVEGKVIKDVTKGTKDWRYITFTDGSVSAETKERITDLIRYKTTVERTGKFATEDSPSQLTRALGSMKMHQDKAKLFSTRDLARDWFKNYIKNLRDMGKEPVDVSFVQAGDKYFPMPKVYADLLEQEGYVRTIMGTKERRILRR